MEEYKPSLDNILNNEELKDTEKSTFGGCGKCSAGYIGDKMCDCFRLEVMKRRYGNANIDYAFASLPIIEDEVEAYLKDSTAPNGMFSIDLNPFIEEYVNTHKENFSSGKGIIFNGPVGRGKSLSSMKVLMMLVDKGYSGYWTTIKNYFDIVKKSWNDEEYEKLKNHIYDCDFLVIDDLGTEYTKTDSDWVPTEIDGLMRHRYFKKKPLIITTNSTLDNMKVKYAQRVISLFSERSFIVPIVSKEDYREKLAKIPDYIDVNRFKKGGK